MTNIEVAQKIKSEGRTMMPIEHLENIAKAVEATKKLDGDMAEVGMWRGGSSKLIYLIGGKNLYSFDTFEGHPEVMDVDKISQYKGKHKADEEEVRAYLREHNEIHVYRGIFPENSYAIRNKKFSFVHIDTDIYTSTRSCIEFFYPRMCPGGIIMLDDYPTIPGVAKAIGEYFRDKSHIQINQLEVHQASIIIPKD